MKYRIEEYKLKNGIEDISIIFDEKYQLLTTFMSCDVLPFEKWIKSGFDRVLSGKSEYEEVNGNVCCAEISPKTTKVYDNSRVHCYGYIISGRGCYGELV